MINHFLRKYIRRIIYFSFKVYTAIYIYNIFFVRKKGLYRTFFVTGKENVYKAYMSKMTLAALGNDFSYRDLGLTSISPDYESTSRILEVANNFNIPVNT